MSKTKHVVCLTEEQLSTILYVLEGYAQGNDDDELVAAVSSSLDFWLTLGKEGSKFEEELSSFLDIKRSILVNSGSSANLLAISSLSSHLIDKEKRIFS